MNHIQRALVTCWRGGAVDGRHGASRLERLRERTSAKLSGTIESVELCQSAFLDSAENRGENLGRGARAAVPHEQSWPHRGHAEERARRVSVEGYVHKTDSNEMRAERFPWTAKQSSCVRSCDSNLLLRTAGNFKRVLRGALTGSPAFVIRCHKQ